MSTYQTLRAANIYRQREWDTGDQMTLSYSGNELAGEVGEAIEAVLQLDGTAVADELGDVVICCDLLAMRFNIDFNLSLLPLLPVSLLLVSGELIEPYLMQLAIDTGGACNVVKKLEREQLGMKGSRSTPADLAYFLNAILIAAHSVAVLRGIDLATATAAKFNKTSEKVGLATRFVPARVVR